MSFGCKDSWMVDGGRAEGRDDKKEDQYTKAGKKSTVTDQLLEERRRVYGQSWLLSSSRKDKMRGNRMRCIVGYHLWVWLCIYTFILLHYSLISLVTWSPISRTVNYRVISMSSSTSYLHFSVQDQHTCRHAVPICAHFLLDLTEITIDSVRCMVLSRCLSTSHQSRDCCIV